MRQEGCARVSGGAPDETGVRLVRDETGDIITGWLGQLLLVMAVLGLLGYELLSVGLTAVAVDDAAGDVARAGARVYDGRDLAAVELAAATEAAEVGVELTAVTVDGEDVVATVTRQAGTLWLHRLGPLEDLTRPSGTARANWTNR